MALTKISTGGVKDDAASQAKIADEAVDEARLQISNAGTNGQFLQKQSGNTGGLTWADVPAGVGGANGADFNDDVKVRLGTGNDLEIYHDGSNSFIKDTGTGNLFIDGGITYLRNAAGDEHLANFNSDGAVNLYHNGVLKLSTNSSGATVSGTLAATAVTGDGSGLTNLPPGGNTVDLVADGAIAAGKPVVIKTNGKAAQVAESYSAMSTPTYDTENYTSANMPTAYCPVPVYSPTAGCYAFLYRSGDYTKILAAKLSNGLWTVGSRLENVSGEGQYSQHASMCVVPASEISGVSHDVLAVIYRDYPGNNDGNFRLGEINSNNSVSLNSSYADITSGDLFRSSMQAVGNAKILLAYSAGTDGVKAMIIDVTGSDSYSTGSEVSVGSSSNSNGVHVSEADSNGKVIITYTNSSNELKAVAASISGTTITLGTEVELDSSALSSLRECKVAYNKDDDNFLAVWSDNSLQCAAMTVSGTTITKSAATQVANIETRGIGVVYDSRLKHFWAHVSRDGDNNNTTNYYYPITETGATAPSIGTAKETTFSNDLLDALNSFYYESDNIVVSVGRRTNSSNEIKLIAAKLGTTTSNITTSSSNSVLNYTNILGFAEDAISDGNTGTIKLPGNVVANQSGLTAGTYYYHKGDGTLATSGDSDIYNAKAGIAVSSSKLVIADPNQQS